MIKSRAWKRKVALFGREVAAVDVVGSSVVRGLGKGDDGL
jgi:hypothetical protein